MPTGYRAVLVSAAEISNLIVREIDRTDVNGKKRGWPGAIQLLDRTGYAVAERLPAAMPAAGTMVAREVLGALSSRRCWPVCVLGGAQSVGLSACCDSPPLAQ